MIRKTNLVYLAEHNNLDIVAFIDYCQGNFPDLIWKCGNESPGEFPLVYCLESDGDMLVSEFTEYKDLVNEYSL